jgi:hypothetical protein
MGGNTHSQTYRINSNTLKGIDFLRPGMLILQSSILSMKGRYMVETVGCDDFHCSRMRFISY